MIKEYHRPERVEDALKLLNSPDLQTIPMGGGLYINEIIRDPIAVVDLQSLNLDQIQSRGKQLQLGAFTSLQQILSSDEISQAVKDSIRHQESYNRRQVATLAGTLIAADGRSPICTVFLALDAQLTVRRAEQKPEDIHLGDLLPLREEILKGALITGVTISNQVRTAYHYAARSPADLPIVCAAAARWPSGRTRVVVGGTGSQPVLVLDGPDGEGAAAAAKSTYSTEGDVWASAEYRSEAAAALVQRCLDDISEPKKDA